MKTDDASVAAAIMGLTAGPLVTSLHEVIRELRAHAGPGAQEYLEKLRDTAIRNIENAAVDDFPDELQLLIVERARDSLRRIFAGAGVA